MWVCIQCHQSIEDSEAICYHCGSAKTLTAEGLHLQLQQQAEPPRDEFGELLEDSAAERPGIRDFGQLFRAGSSDFWLKYSLIGLLGAALVADGIYDVTPPQWEFFGLVYIVIGGLLIGKVVTAINRASIVHPAPSSPTEQRT